MAVLGQVVRATSDPRPELSALLEREYSADRAVLYGSGTQALTIAIRDALARLDGESTVALPAFACFDVATAAVAADARVALYDIDPATLAPDLESLEQVLRKGASVLVIAPLYGIPVDWDAIKDLADSHGALLIEDAAQGSGARWKGRAVGSFGQLSVLSFGRGKGWTGGNGGAVLHRGATPRDNIAGGVSLGREIRNGAALMALWAFARPGLYAVPASIPYLGLGETTYKPPQPAAAMTRGAAAMLLSTHAAAGRDAVARRTNAEKFLARIAGVPGIRTISVNSRGVAGYLRLPIRLENGEGLRIARRSSTHGVEQSYPSTLRDLPAIASRLIDRNASYPGAERLVRELLTLPTHSRMRSEDFARIVSALSEP